MDKEQNTESLLIKILKNSVIIFSLSVLVFSVAGMTFKQYDPVIQKGYSMFAFAPIGIAYVTILQIAGFSFILAAITVFVFSDYFFREMRFLWRSFILFLATILVFLAFALIFKWVPVNEPVFMLTFFLFTIVCYSISIGLTFLKIKLERKKYDKLLANYRKNIIINS